MAQPVQLRTHLFPPGLYNPDGLLGNTLPGNWPGEGGVFGDFGRMVLMLNVDGCDPQAGPLPAEEMKDKLSAAAGRLAKMHRAAARAGFSATVQLATPLHGTDQVTATYSYVPGRVEMLVSDRPQGTEGRIAIVPWNLADDGRYMPQEPFLEGIGDLTEVGAMCTDIRTRVLDPNSPSRLELQRTGFVPHKQFFPATGAVAVNAQRVA